MSNLTESIQKYTDSEVFKTAAMYIEDYQNGLGAGLKCGINQVCQCCKAGSLIDGKPVGIVDKIVDELDLKPWSDFYKTKEFAAYKCRSCGYQWSWFKS